MAQEGAAEITQTEFLEVSWRSMLSLVKMVSVRSE